MLLSATMPFLTSEVRKSRRLGTGAIQTPKPKKRSLDKKTCLNEFHRPFAFSRNVLKRRRDLKGKCSPGLSGLHTTYKVLANNIHQYGRATLISHGICIYIYTFPSLRFSVVCFMSLEVGVWVGVHSRRRDCYPVHFH